MTTRGRKPLQPAINSIDIDEELVGSDLARIDQLPAMESSIQENTLALAKQLSYEGALTIESLEEEIKFYQRRSVEAVLETGKRLLLLKEISDYGTFHERLDALGFSPRLAQQFMGATLKFSNTKSTSLLALPNLGQTKLLELLVLDDGDIAALNSGEQIRGITLDDVDCMSVSELRRALRKEKADKEATVSKVHADVSGQLAAKDRLIADSKKRIAELVEEKNKREGMTDIEREEALEARLSAATLDAVTHLFPIRAAIDSIRGLEHVPQGLYVAMQAALHRVITEAESIANDYCIGLDFGLPTLNSEDALADLDDPNADEEFGPDYQPL